MVSEFFQKYYIDPLIYPHTEVYNIYNTLTYALILIGMVILTYKLLKKLNVSIDNKFFIGTSPFIILAAVLRVLRDADFYQTPLLVTPLLYIVVFIITLSALVLSVSLKRFLKIPYNKYLFAIGVSLIALFGINLTFVNLIAIGQVGCVAFLTFVMIFLAGKISESELFSPLNMAVLGGAMFDAASTFIGIALYSYAEKHVLPSLLISYTGAWIMLPLKFFVVLLTLYLIDKSESEPFFKNFLKFTILVITLGPGVRNTLRLAGGV